MIPSFLLAKLYVKGSLKNTETGFEFSLKNIIDSTMLIGIGPVTVGERDTTARRSRWPSVTRASAARTSPARQPSPCAWACR